MSEFLRTLLAVMIVAQVLVFCCGVRVGWILRGQQRRVVGLMPERRYYWNSPPRRVGRDVREVSLNDRYPMRTRPEV